MEPRVDQRRGDVRSAVSMLSFPLLSSPPFSFISPSPYHGSNCPIMSGRQVPPSAHLVKPSLPSFPYDGSLCLVVPSSTLHCVCRTFTHSLIPAPSPFTFHPHTSGGSVSQAAGRQLLSLLFPPPSSSTHQPDNPSPPLHGSISPLATYLGSRAASMAPFSSWGPTPDGRTKPDVVAPGDGWLGFRR